MKDMIGYCGLDCEKCDAYIATVNDDQILREKTAKLWAELNNAPILPEHIIVLFPELSQRKPLGFFRDI